MLVRVSLSALKDTRTREYLVRFLLGGVATVFAGLVAKLAGPPAGGLFLALPAIFCASATLIESHEIRRKREKGLHGERRGKKAAGLEASGAVFGGLGMLLFSITFSAMVTHSVALAFVCASVGWLLGSLAAWWSHRRLRKVARKRASHGILNLFEL
jgi:hypothetical protein